MSTEPLITNETSPRRAPDTEDCAPTNTDNRNPTRQQLNDDFLRVDLSSQQPPTTQSNTNNTTPHPQTPHTQPVATQHPPQQHQQQPPPPMPAMPAPGYQYVQVPVYNPWTDPKIAGQLALTIESAHLTKNYGLTNMNPYCRIRLGHHLCKTKVSEGSGKNPVWHHRSALPLPVDVDMIYIEVYDECTLQSDQMIAWVCIPIPGELVITGGEQPTKMYKLSGKQGAEMEGTIAVRFSFILSKNMPKNVPVMQSAFYSPPPMMMYPPPMHSPYMYGYPAYGAGYAVSPYAAAGTTPVTVQTQRYPMASCNTAAHHPTTAAAGARNAQMGGPPPINESDVKSLKETFPNVEEEVVRSVLENCGGNKAQAADLLLQMSSSS